MKTIFISIFEGVEAKNILRTPLLSNLLEDKSLRIILLTKSKSKADYYRNEFNDDRLIFEVVEWKMVSVIDKFFSKLKFFLLRTESTILKRKMISEINGNLFKYHLIRILNYIFARPSVILFFRLLDSKFVRDRTFSDIFDKYSPDLILLAHLFDEIEINLLREARIRNVKSIGFINSWDKVTSRCILRLHPDRMIVFNENVKKELIKYNLFDAKKIFISGLPQYDYYFNTQPLAKKDFFKKVGISEDKKIILYAPMGRSFSVSDWDVIDYLYEIINSSEVTSSIALLVRFQPNDFVDINEIKKRPHLKYDMPGIRFDTKRGVDWDMSFNDLEHLRDTLFHISILICYASSITIDAAIFDKPIINVNFEIHKSKFILKSPIQYYNYSHYKNVLLTGAVDLVNSKIELIRSINKYISDPSIKTEERKTLVKNQIMFTDGNSGKRIANYLLNNLK